MTVYSVMYQWEMFKNAIPFMELISISNKCVLHKGDVAIHSGYKLLKITPEKYLGNEHHFSQGPGCWHENSLYLHSSIFITSAQAFPE